MNLDLTRLDCVKTSASGKTTAACPACREAGSDKKGDHLVIWPDGRFGCVANEKDTEHRKRIFALVGEVERKEPACRKPPVKSFPSFDDAARACCPADSTLSEAYAYGDVGGVARYESTTGKTFRQFRKAAAGWQAGAPMAKWPLYGDPAGKGRVYVVEGEKCAIAATSIGLNAVCSAGGASAASKTDWTALAGREVVILPDADLPGEKYATSVIGILSGLDPRPYVSVVRLPGLSDGGDIADFIEARDAIDASAIRAEVESLVESSAPSRIISAASLVSKTILPPPEIIHGVIRAGQVGMMAASSKAGKSWALLDLGMSVATGTDWLGWKTTQSRILYINAELPIYDLRSRLEQLATSRGMPCVPANFYIWHKRGEGQTIAELVNEILDFQRDNGAFGLIMPDPLYCFGGGRDENDNSEQAMTMGEMSSMAERTGAALWVAHHFSKGNKRDTEHLDRASGAGMFARAVDTFMTLTRHEEENCYTAETTCRSFPKPDSVVVRWEYPIWRIDGSLDPDALKKPAHPNGRPGVFAPEQLANLLISGPMEASKFQLIAKQSTGISRRRFYELLKVAVAKGLVTKLLGGLYERN